MHGLEMQVPAVFTVHFISRRSHHRCEKSKTLDISEKTATLTLAREQNSRRITSSTSTQIRNFTHFAGLYRYLTVKTNAQTGEIVALLLTTKEVDATC